MTLKSGKVYSNIGTPSNTYGVDGDIYMQLDGLKTTYRKEGAVWVAVGSSLGAIPEFISGSGVPSSLLGADGQYYRNVENQDIYYKSGGIWSAIGNLQGLAFQALLIQHGIGKDLGTAPNLINSGSLNTVIEPGEYYYEAGVGDKPTDGNGLLKVWREDEDYIYQIAHIGITGKLSSRYSNDGGANWTSWFDYGRTQGYDDVDFHVSGGVDPNSAVSYGQLSLILGLVAQGPDFFQVGDWKLKWGHTFLGDDSPATAHTTTITGFTEIKTVLVGSTTTDNYGAFVYHRQSFDNNSVTVVFDEWSAQIQNGLGYWWLAIGK